MAVDNHLLGSSAPAYALDDLLQKDIAEEPAT